LCKSLPSKHVVFESPAEDCACFEIPNATRKLAPPFEAVTILRRGCGYHESDDGTGFAELGFVEYELAIKVASGWFVQTVGESDLLGHSGERLTIESIRQPALGTGPSVAITYRIVGNWYHRAEARDWDRTDVVVFGVGPSGTPSGTPPIAQTRLEMLEDNGTKTRPVDVAFGLS
jgi:hypothetical protein